MSSKILVLDFGSQYNQLIVTGIRQLGVFAELKSAAMSLEEIREYNPCGIVLRTRDGKCAYHMGDTEIFGDMALINEIFAPQVGMVPIGDRFTMGARTAAMACKKYFSFTTIIPIHFGTFPILDPSADKFLGQMGGHNVVVPEVGQAVEA